MLSQHGAPDPWGASIAEIADRQHQSFMGWMAARGGGASAHWRYGTGMDGSTTNPVTGVAQGFTTTDPALIAQLLTDPDARARYRKAANRGYYWEYSHTSYTADDETHTVVGHSKKVWLREDAQGGGGSYQGAGMVNNISFLIDGTTILTTRFLVNEYKRGGDVVDILKGVKTVVKIGKLSIALNIGAVGYDIVSGNVQSSTVVDVAMIVGGVIIGVAIGPITAGVVGIVYGGAMIMGGQDAINNAFNGNWNLQINKAINNTYRK